MEDWTTKPLVCSGNVLLEGRDSSKIFLTCEAPYRMRLIMKSIEMRACEGRQLSLQDIDLMEGYYEELEEDKPEYELRDLARKFESDFAYALGDDTIAIDERAVKLIARR